MMKSELKWLDEVGDAIGFTKREMDCVPYLLAGNSFKEIGTLLGLSHRTIEAYVKNMRMKIGAKTKRALVAKIVEMHDLCEIF